MKVKQIMYSTMAVAQYTYKFNQTYQTDIIHDGEVLDGSPFVYIDFKETPQDLVFKYAYELGMIQQHLGNVGERWLPVADYPFPPEEI